MPIQFLPFQDSLLPQAAALLANRHRRDRIALPELPARFEEASVARRSIEAVLARKHAAGFAALDGDRLIAYLIGDMTVDDQRGRSGWVRSPGCAYDPDAGVEVVRDLYAFLGAKWVGDGVFSHFVLLPTTEAALVHAWFSLSFGIEQIHALVDLKGLDPVMPDAIPGIEVRRAEPSDGEHLVEISDVIWRHQVRAPAWGAMMPDLVAEVEEGWAGLADDADATVWLALADGKPVGVQGYWPADASDEAMHIPEKCVYLSIAGTRAESRGMGIGTLMTAYGLAQAAAEGYRICETDWRSTNLTSSRFWPRCGFRPAVYRLVRQVDPRIAWALGSH